MTRISVGEAFGASTLAAVFIPILFMQGILGRLFREFAVTIISSLLMYSRVRASRDRYRVFAHVRGRIDAIMAKQAQVRSV